MVLNGTEIFAKTLGAYRNKNMRRAFNEGGTYSSKTFSILQTLFLLTLHSKTPLLVSIVSESIPHLKRGCIRDWRKILGDAYDPERYNETDRIYEVKPGVFVEFFSADDAEKLRGGRRDILYMNECNNITKHAYDELDVRTERFTFTDNNPTAPFWMHDLKCDKENAYIHSTYQDAKEFLPEAVVKNIESRRYKDPNWWHVYGEGLVGKVEGLVHPFFTTCKVWPEELVSSGIHGYGLDFGYSNDPTALVENLIVGETLYSRILLYRTGLTNRDIIRALEANGVRKRYDQIFADCNEPKSIDEIYVEGYDIRGVSKGKDSVEAGIQKVNQFNQVWTEDSLDGIDEQRNYRYVEDKNGKVTNKTIEHSNHAMDARRYWVWMAVAEALYNEVHASRVAI
jgi:phage terminase large subunit